MHYENGSKIYDISFNSLIKESNFADISKIYISQIQQIVQIFSNNNTLI